MRPVAATALVLAACLATGAIAGRPARAAERCSLPVIIVLADASPTRPATSLVISLARAARIRLSYVRDAGTRSFLFRLTAKGDDASCLRGLERLRRDPRVRAADIDEQRQPHAAPVTP